MKILMLVNWKIEYTDTVPKDKQPPDYYVPGQPYWFFRYFKDKDISVDVADISSFPALEDFEKNTVRFYTRQTLKVLGKLKDYDVVISHGMQSGIVLALLRKLFGKGSYKHIVFDIGAFNSARETGLVTKFMRYAGRSIDGIIYHTPAQIDYYRKVHPWLLKKAVYIPFGTDTEFFNAESDSEKIKDKDKNPDNDAGYILCAGYNKRDWETLTEAYLESDRTVPLRYLGNKDLIDKILDKYRDYDNESAGHCLNKLNIQVYDSVSVIEFREQIRNALFCVLPLKNFNYSFGQMTMLQQMAMGKAVVAADVPSLKPYFAEGANIKYDPENVRDLSDKLNNLFRNPGMCSEIGNKASELVRREFNEKIMAEKIEKTIKYFCN